MKKISKSIFVVMMCLVFFASNSFAACSWGSTWLSYTLSNSGTNVKRFEFKPGTGDHKIQVSSDPLTIITTLEWSNNAGASWNQFHRSMDTGVFSLNAGSSSITFRITFELDPMKDGSHTVRWKYCIGY